MSGDDGVRVLFAEFVDLMYRRRDVRLAFDRYVSEDYIQHNPGLPDGRAAARDSLAVMFAEPSFEIEVVRELCDGDLCAVHLRVRRRGVDVAAVIDIYRATGRRIVEHWDVIQPWPVASANEHPMF